MAGQDNQKNDVVAKWVADAENDLNKFYPKDKRETIQEVAIAVMASLMGGSPGRNPEQAAKVAANAAIALYNQLEVSKDLIG